MPNNLVTLATFHTPVTAGFVKNLLQSEGVPAYLADETTSVMLWHLSIAIGWVKLQVADTDVSRATEVLEVCQQAVRDLGEQAFADEALTSAAEDGVADIPPDAAPIDELDDPGLIRTEELAARALRSAVLGMCSLLFAIWALLLIGFLTFSRSELTAKASRKLWLAFAITIGVLFGYSTISGVAGIVVTYGAAVAAFGIRELVRWINRRDHPRYASFPDDRPDTPPASG